MRKILISISLILVSLFFFNTTIFADMVKTGTKNIKNIIDIQVYDVDGKVVEITTFEEDGMLMNVIDVYEDNNRINKVKIDEELVKKIEKIGEKYYTYKNNSRSTVTKEFYNSKAGNEVGENRNTYAGHNTIRIETSTADGFRYDFENGFARVFYSGNMTVSNLRIKEQIVAKSTCMYLDVPGGYSTDTSERYAIYDNNIDTDHSMYTLYRSGFYTTSVYSTETVSISTSGYVKYGDIIAYSVVSSNW